MRKAIVLLGALLLVSGLGWAQAQEESIADVARRVRAERAKKDTSKVPLFTNENMPRASAGPSTAGAALTAAGPVSGGEAAGGEAAAAEGEKKSDCDEQCWRGKFKALREKVGTAQRELDILQREYNLSRTQHYQDPNQAIREQYSGNVAGGRQLQDLQRQMSEKQTEIQRSQQELSNLEDELRRTGGNPGWARE